ncbi:MAG: ester cyclase, partial [Thioalkalispiraceae bacterium]
HVTRDFFVTEGDMVIERARANATHKGELAGLDPTNKPVTWTELHAYRVKNGKITDIWSEASLLGVLEQIGAVNLPAGEQ